MKILRTFVCALSFISSGIQLGMMMAYGEPARSFNWYVYTGLGAVVLVIWSVVLLLSATRDSVREAERTLLARYHKDLVESDRAYEDTIRRMIQLPSSRDEESRIN